MKKRLLRTCAGILAAMMLMETAFAGNMSARVYADEIDEVVDELNSEIIDETLTDEVQTLSSKEEIPEEDINVTEEEIQEEETVVSEEALNGGETITCSIYFDTVGGTLATNKKRLTETRYDVESVSGTKTIRAVINGSFAFGVDENGVEETIETVYIPFKPNYEFEGWFDKDGNEFNFNATLAESVDDDGKIVAYAKWKPSKNMTDIDIVVKNNPVEVHDYHIIQMKTAEPGAIIYYTIGDDDPDVNNGKHYYGEMIIRDLIGDVTAPTTLKVNARAVKNGCKDKVVSEEFIVTPAWGDVTPEQQTELFHNDISELPKGMWIDGFDQEKDSKIYTGKDITFKNLKVYYNNKLLEEGKNYEVTYSNNKNAYVYAEGHTKFDAAKAPTLKIAGLGNYVSKYTAHFVINKVDLSDVVFDDPVQAKANGTVQKLVPVGTYNKNVLKNTVDFTVEYTSKGTGAYKDALKEDEASYVLKVTGKGNYKGTRYLQERLTKYSFNDSNITGPIGVCDLTFNPAYTGTGARYWAHPDMGKEIIIRRGSTDLVYGRDFKLLYATKAPKIGTTSVRIIGCGDYSGEFVKEYEITAPSSSSYRNIKDCQVVGFEEEVVYGTNLLGNDQSDTMIVKTSSGETTLVKDVDYIVEADPESDLINVGEVTIYIVANKSPFYGEKKLKFKIVPRKITDKDVKITYDNNAVLVNGVAKPNVTVTFKGITLVEGKDYTLSYDNNTHTFSSTSIHDPEKSDRAPKVTIKGKGNFDGSTERNFTISGGNFSTVRVHAADKLYQNVADNYKTTYEVTDATGENVLVKGTHYEKTIEYSYVDWTYLDNGDVRKPGEKVHKGDIVPYGTWMRVSVTPKGLYQGEALDLDEDGEIDCDSNGNPIHYATVSATYKITKYDINNAEVVIADQRYTGHSITLNKNQILVKYGSRFLSDNEYEIVEYSKNKNYGTATVKIRGIGNYGGEKIVEFRILRDYLGRVITFNPNGAEKGTMAVQKVRDLVVDKVPVKLTKNAYTRKGYEFAGWNTASDGTGTFIKNKETLINVVDKGLVDEGNILILYAQWKPIEYKITVYTNGGTFDKSLIPSKYTADDVIEPYPVPDCSTWPRGYMFGGWFSDSAFKTRVYRLTHGTTGDIKLYAKWIPYTYKIKYNANYSTKTKMADSIASYGEEKALSENIFKRSGYAFMGWSTKPSPGVLDKIIKNKAVISHRDLGISEVNNINQEVTLYAIWRKVFTVSFDSNGGNPVDSMTYTYGKSMKLPTPKKTGYTFAGWYTNSEFTKKIDSITSTKKSDYNLVAKWTANKYTIAFNKNSSSATGTMSALSMKYNTPKELIKNKFVRKGYKFDGWNTKKDGSGTPYANKAEVSNLTSTSGKQVTLYAQWSKAPYTITYNVNGGTFSDIPTTEYTYGKKLSLPKPTKTGYVFGGWYKEETFKTKISSIKDTQYGNLKLYAKWTSESTNLEGRQFPITVIGVADSEWKGTNIIPDEYTYGDVFSFPSGDDVPIRDGYTFAGWYKDAAYSKKITGVKATTYDDLKVYAKWTPKTYKVYYKINKPAEVDSKLVTGKDTTSTFKFGTETTLKQTGYKIKGYSFKGWSLTPNGAVLYGKDGKIAGVPAGEGWTYGNVSLYAIWEMKTYTITYMNMKDIPNASPTTYNVNQKVTLVSPSAVGRTFQGWYTEPEFTHKVKAYEAGTTGNKTLYAKWRQNAYNITYDLNAGKDAVDMKDGLVGYISNYFTISSKGKYILPDAERRGYKFLGWSASKEGTNPMTTIKPTTTTVNMVLYASWKAIDYKLVYDYGYKVNDSDKKNKIVEKTYNISNNLQRLKVPTRYGYRFIAWHEETLTGTIRTDIYPGEIGNLELVAQWDPISYSIQYNLNGAPGNAPGKKSNVYANEPWKISSLVPTWEGHEFVGWKLDGGPSTIFKPGQTVNAEAFKINRNTTGVLRAVWR